MLTRLTLLAALLATQSCCGVLMGVFGCVPESSPLVPVAYDTPERALATVLAAIREGDAKVIYESLDPAMKQELGVDGLAFAVAWDRLQARYPAIRLAGSAEVVERSKPSPTRRAFVLGIYGERLTVVFERRAYYDLGLYGEDDEVVPFGAFCGQLDEMLKAVDPKKSTASVIVEDEALFGRRNNEVAFVHVGWTWRVRELRQEGGS